MATEGVIVNRHERRKRRTRDSIVDAARSLFLERGFEQTTLTEVAERADIAASTLFTHFSTKADLFFADYDLFVDDFIETLIGRDRLRESAIDATIRWHTEMPLLDRDEAPDFEWFSGIRRLIDNDPLLPSLEQQQYERALTVLAREVALDFGDSELDLRPQLIAAVKATMLFTQSRFEAYLDLGEAEDSFSRNLELTVYVGECLRAAVAAIAEVPVPGVTKHAAPRSRVESA
jgi:AcrR family transcriptional regulator